MQSTRDGPGGLRRHGASSHGQSFVEAFISNLEQLEYETYGLVQLDG